MDHRTHRRALATAARLALGATALQACTTKPASEPVAPTRTPAPAPDPTPARYVAADEPAPAAAPVDPIRNCEGLVDEAFPKESEYPGEKRNVGAAVEQCCAELIVHEGADIGRHRWDCCANLPADLSEPDARAVAMACTPWGPPVPPAMPRRRPEVA